MNSEQTEIRIRGKNVMVPAVRIAERKVISTGNWIRLARIMDEELLEGTAVAAPESFIVQLRSSGLKADVFTFAQKPPDVTPRYGYPQEWDNWAAIPTTSFRLWWEDRLPQESRKNVRRAAKRGVVVRVVPFTDELVRGIQGIYNETPVRQGKTFWHFGKHFADVKRENATYPERSEFVGAFLNEELIGFIKFIYVDRIAVLIQILAKNAHHDKRPMNALLAYTVELCERKGVSLLVYGQYVYGPKQNSSLTEFKRRNGFEEVRFPRYYIPLSARGHIAVRCGLHLGVTNLIPGPIMDRLLWLRSWILEGHYRPEHAARQEM
jgi:hypothetical protein